MGCERKRTHKKRPQAYECNGAVILRHRWPIPSWTVFRTPTQTFNLSLPAVETPAHGLTAATPTTTAGAADNNRGAGLRRSLRPTAGRRRTPPSPSGTAQDSASSTSPVNIATTATTTAAAAVPPAHDAQPSASSSAYPKKPPRYHHPVVAVAATAAAAAASPPPGSGRDSPSTSACAAVAGTHPLVLQNLVKMEVSSDCEGDGNLSGGGGACASAAAVDGGYSSSSTLDDTACTSYEEHQQEHQHQQCLTSERAEFDKDGNAACDSLLREILGQQDGSGDDDEFLSLLSDGDGDGDMMIVNPASEGLNEGFVKREPNNTNVVF